MSEGRRPEHEPAQLHCPSGRPEFAGSVVFGVISGTPSDPRMIPLAEVLPVTDELLAKAAPVAPTEVFRIASPCATTACMHWDGVANCTLAQRVVAGLPAVADGVPFCRIRPTCRWFKQEGRAACMRCPLIVTDSYNVPDEYIPVAGPMFSVPEGRRRLSGAAEPKHD